MLLIKYLQHFEGVWCFWKKMKANLGARCYYIFIRRFLKVLYVILKIIESIFFLFVIEGFF